METRELYETEFDMKKIWAAIKKVWIYCCIMIVVCGSGAYILSYYFIPKTYEATGKIIVVSNNKTANDQLSYNDLQLNQKLVTTYSQIIKSERISDIIIRRLHSRINTQDYRSMVNVTAQQDTEVMNIVVKDTSPYFAATLANEIIMIFIQELPSIMPVENVSVLNNAKTPINPVSPNLLINTTVGILLGGMLSGLLCLIVMYSDRKIKTNNELSDIVAYPFIGNIPFIDVRPYLAKNIPMNESLVAYYDPRSLAAEAYRSLRTNIMLRNFDSELKTINVISCGQAEGKTSLILNLAIVFGQIGKKVLVVDLDLRAPSIHRKLGMKNDKGITDLINQQAKWSDTIRSYNEYIDVITAGSKLPFAAEFLQSKTLSSFMKAVKLKYDYVLLDSPPAGLVTDGTIVSKLADGTIFLCECDANERKQLLQLDDLIKQFGIQIIGSVMNKVPVHRRYQYYRDEEEQLIGKKQHKQKKKVDVTSATNN